MILGRRRFLQSMAAAATAPVLSTPVRAVSSPFGKLRPDPDRIIDLPDGFSYTVVSRAGTPMADGLRVPGSHDGMAAFGGGDGRITLICNHELGPEDAAIGAFSEPFRSSPAWLRDKIYDNGAGLTPSNGGTTTTVFNLRSGEIERQFLSLVGTVYNCAGGPTPWGSWLSCEETFRDAGRDGRWHYNQRHGYVFEVSASATEPVEPQPIKAMGRFEHEAAAVHVASGIVYMTEDRSDSLFYRYIPVQPGHLQAGGQLQALAIGNGSSVNTSNWAGNKQIRINNAMPVHWINLDDPDGDKNDLRLRGAADGAAIFMRGEGLCVAGDDLFLTATTGGPAGLGQVFRYRVSEFEGRHKETESPGTLTLFAEADQDSLLRNADNLTMAPWGDLLVCEDTAGHCGLVGIRPDGAQYEVCDNAYTDSELAGVCFAPDGRTLFVNIQYPGMTLAITGPWPAA